jgi:hypothetical protein
LKLGDQHAINGVFKGMYGDVDFEGYRQDMPTGMSGQNITVDYYRQGWKGQI